MLFHFLADEAKHVTYRGLFILGSGDTERMVRIDAVYSQLCRFIGGTLKRRDVKTDGFVPYPVAVTVKAYGHGRDLEQGVRLAIKATGLDIDDYGEKTAKAVGHRYRIDHEACNPDVPTCIERLCDSLVCQSSARARVDHQIGDRRDSRRSRDP